QFLDPGPPHRHGHAHRDTREGAADHHEYTQFLTGGDERRTQGRDQRRRQHEGPSAETVGQRACTQQTHGHADGIADQHHVDEEVAEDALLPVEHQQRGEFVSTPCHGEHRQCHRQPNLSLPTLVHIHDRYVMDHTGFVNRKGGTTAYSTVVPPYIGGDLLTHLALVTPLDPFLQVWSLGTNRGVVTVSGAHGGLCRQIQDGGLQGFDNGVEGAVLAPRRTGTALEEGVAGEQFI